MIPWNFSSEGPKVVQGVFHLPNIFYVGLWAYCLSSGILPDVKSQGMIQILFHRLFVQGRHVSFHQSINLCAPAKSECLMEKRRQRSTEYKLEAIVFAIAIMAVILLPSS